MQRDDHEWSQVISVSGTAGVGASGPSAGVSVGGQVSTVEGASSVITTPPDHGKGPAPLTKYGDPADQLKTKNKRFVPTEKGAVLQFGVRVLDRANGNSIGSAVLEIDGRRVDPSSDGSETSIRLELSRSDFATELDLGRLDSGKPSDAPDNEVLDALRHARAQLNAGGLDTTRVDAAIEKLRHN